MHSPILVKCYGAFLVTKLRRPEPMQNRGVRFFFGTMTTGAPHPDIEGRIALHLLILFSSSFTISRFQGPARCGCDRVGRAPGTRSIRCWVAPMEPRAPPVHMTSFFFSFRRTPSATEGRSWSRSSLDKAFKADWSFGGIIAGTGGRLGLPMPGFPARRSRLPPVFQAVSPDCPHEE